MTSLHNIVNKSHGFGSYKILDATKLFRTFYITKILIFIVQDPNCVGQGNEYGPP